MNRIEKMDLKLAAFVEKHASKGNDLRHIACCLFRAGMKLVKEETGASVIRLQMQDENVVFTTPNPGFTIDTVPEPLTQADFPAVQDDSDALAPLPPFDGPLAFLRAAYDAIQAEQPIKAVRLSIDDRIVLQTFVAIGFANIDDVSDNIGVSASGRLWLGIRPDGVLDLPVEVASVTGNIDERELAARYMESKIARIDHELATHNVPVHQRQMAWEESYQHTAIVLRNAADEFRQGLHLPSDHIDGKVIPYNEDRSTGVSHHAGLRLFFQDVYARNVKAGWWTDIHTGDPKKRNVGELFILMVTELVEAYDAYMTQSPDDKLPHYPGVGIEMGDLLIRIADFCGALEAGAVVGFDMSIHNPGEDMFAEIRDIAHRYERIRKTPEAHGDVETADYIPPMDVAIMVDAKLDFNAHRPDHKIENRLKEDGKRT